MPRSAVHDARGRRDAAARARHSGQHCRGGRRCGSRPHSSRRRLRERPSPPTGGRPGYAEVRRRCLHELVPRRRGSLAVRMQTSNSKRETSCEMHSACVFCRILYRHRVCPCPLALAHCILPLPTLLSHNRSVCEAGFVDRLMELGASGDPHLEHFASCALQNVTCLHRAFTQCLHTVPSQSALAPPRASHSAERTRPSPP